jgi:medium-chain acyl-[acyl-carrier-protein] hydrolase
VTSASVSPWFVRGSFRGPSVDLRLFCFPHGGAGPSVFRGWQAAAGPRVEVVPVQLPGRERRMSEPSVRSITELRDLLAGPIAEYAEATPYAFLGHSMGALVAYELCHQLRDSARPPSAVAVSGAVAPHLPRRVPDVHDLPDDDFRRHVTALNGTPSGLLADDSWLDLLMPVLRADFEACETYVPRQRPLLELPLLALGGTGDPLARPTEVEAWAELTAGPSEVRIYDGDHFFLFQHADEVIDMIGGLAARDGGR